jgi:tetratricopeptide (TPR) repeat protein
VKARLLEAAGDDDEARKVLEAAVDRQAPEPKVLLPLGRLYFNMREFAKAVEMFELGRKAEPQDSRWLVQLAQVHTEAGDKEKLIAVLKDLAPTDADDLDVRKRLAKLSLEAEKPAEAERWARQVLEIDVLDGPAREMLLKALAAQQKEGEAERLRKLFE